MLITCLSTGYATVQQSENIREVFVKAKDAEIFCKVMGKGKPIVILHGGPGLTHAYLLPQMAKLAEDHLVIFYDQRACGFSTGEISPSSMQIDIFVEDLECIREAFGFKQMTVLGHSWGGFLAMQYAIAYPEAVNKLILSNPTPPSSDDFSLYVKEFMGRMEPYQEELKAVKETQGFIDGDPSICERYYRICFRTYWHHPEKANALNLRMTPKAFIDGVRVNEVFWQNVFVHSFNYHDQLKKLKIPTLIIHGVADLIPQISAQKIHESIPNSKYILLKDCGHFPYLEAPELFFNELNAFLSKKINGRRKK